MTIVYQWYHNNTRMKKRPAAPAVDNRKQRMVRIDSSVWQRLLAYQDDLRAKNKLSVTFSEVTRSVIDAGLTSLGR